jgi:asparagine synthase (glutamine-hydrolysing)
MKHRGPDDDGYYSTGNVHIGMTRLAILDLRKGLYPLRNENKSLHVVYNGEIYNFAELTSELTAEGHSFSSLTDGEVIVHSYEQWGPDCFKRFNGMWAFVLWDANEEKLILARDHFGIKPLYYYMAEDFLAFASEIRALLSLPFIERNPNERSVYNYLVDGHVDQTEETFFEGIFRLMPGHYASVTPNGSLEKTQYWKMPSISEEANREDMDKASEQLRKLFIDAVRIRLISDVPVGVCLSGGLDSSSIVSVIARLDDEHKKSIGQRLHGFSALFPNDPVNESNFVNIAAEATGTEVHAVYPTASECKRDLLELIRTQEEPFASTSTYAGWKVMQSAKAHGITVLLDGQGGDEVFAGYLEYFKFYIIDLLRKKKILTAFQETLRSLDLTFPLIPLLFAYRSKIRNTIRDYLNAEFSAKFGKSTDQFRIDSSSTLAQTLWKDTTQFILPSLLRYEDKNSMHFSIETRLPFLDPRLVEYVASLPIDFKIRDGWTKRVFREAMRDIVPRKIVQRRSKVGFETPQEKWFLGDLGKEIEGLLSSDMYASKFVNREAVLALFRAALRKKKISSWDANLIWRCVNLELWLREFISARPSLSRLD